MRSALCRARSGFRVLHTTVAGCTLVGVSIDGRFSSASPFATLASTMTSRTKQRGSNKRFSFVGKEDDRSESRPPGV